LVALALSAVAFALAFKTLPATHVATYTELWIAPFGQPRSGVMVGVKSGEPIGAAYRLEVRFGSATPIARHFSLAPGEGRLLSFPLARPPVRGALPVRALLLGPRRAAGEGRRRVFTWIPPGAGGR
jgi:hypothetical protein